MAAKEFRCIVQSFKMLTPTVFELTFEGEKILPENPDFAFEAGQFVSVVVPGAGPNGRDLRRAYSIASAPEVKPVELCVKLVEGGPGTNYLYKLRAGDVFKGFAPYGDFTYEPKPGRYACFIATGTGIAPFRSMILSKAYQASPPEQAWCLMGVRTKEELCYVDDLADRPGLHWVPAVSQPVGDYDGFIGRVTDWLRARPADFPWHQTEFYLCGSGPMITEVKTILHDKGVVKESIHQEKYY
jgi:ferredoxin-NADP reductase